MSFVKKNAPQYKTKQLFKPVNLVMLLRKNNNACTIKPLNNASKIDRQHISNIALVVPK